MPAPISGPAQGVQAQRETLNLRELDQQAEAGLLIDQESRLTFLAENARPATWSPTRRSRSPPLRRRRSATRCSGRSWASSSASWLAFLRDSLDRRLHGVKDIQEELPYPLRRPRPQRRHGRRR